MDVFKTKTLTLQSWIDTDGVVDAVDKMNNEDRLNN